MQIDTIILIGFLASIFLTVLGIVYFLPPLIIKLRAMVFGLHLTVKQARAISQNFCNKKDFLVSVRDIWKCAEIPIEKLIAHHLAGGNMINLRDGIIEMTQKGKEVDFQILSALDLAGRNLKEEIRKAELNNWVFALNSRES